MHACSTACSLAAEMVVDYSYVFAVEASPPDVEMARLVGLRYSGEWESVPTCVCDGVSILFSLFPVT